MIAVDTNILVYASRSESPHHARALTVVRSLEEGDRPWAIAWPCVSEFLSIVTHQRVYQPPTPMAYALGQVEDWMASPSLRLIGESPGYWDQLKTILMASQVQGPKVHDARIAAICRAAGVREIWTADRDYSRFPGLILRNPLA